jgi:hypothetical protein
MCRDVEGGIAALHQLDVNAASNLLGTYSKVAQWGNDLPKVEQQFRDVYLYTSAENIFSRQANDTELTVS